MIPSGDKTPQWVGLPSTSICEHSFSESFLYGKRVAAAPVSVVGDGICGAGGIFGAEFFNALCLHFSWMWVQQP